MREDKPTMSTYPLLPLCIAVNKSLFCQYLATAVYSLYLTKYLSTHYTQYGNACKCMCNQSDTRNKTGLCSNTHTLLNLLLNINKRK